MTKAGRTDWKHGAPVRVNARVESDDGERFRGREGKVLGDNPIGRASEGTGRVVNVQLTDGSVISVPEKALDKR